MIIYIVLLQLFAHLDESTVQRVIQASHDVGVANTTVFHTKTLENSFLDI